MRGEEGERGGVVCCVGVLEVRVETEGSSLKTQEVSECGGGAGGQEGDVLRAEVEGCGEGVETFGNLPEEGEGWAVEVVGYYVK